MKPPPDYDTIMAFTHKKETAMKTPKDNGGGTPHRAARAALRRRAGDDPSPRRERATGRLCAAVREAAVKSRKDDRMMSCPT